MKKEQLNEKENKEKVESGDDGSLFKAGGLEVAYRKQKEFNFVGFAIFDIIHIITAVVIYILLLSTAEGSHLQYAECIVEIVLSVTLIGFVHALAEDKKNEGAPAKFISYAWLLAVSSMLIPTLFKFAGLFVDELDFADVLDIVSLVLGLATYGCFFASLFIANESNAWKLLCYIGILLFILGSVAGVMHLFVVDHFSHGPVHIACFFLEIAKYIAPFILAGFSIVGLINADISDNGRIL